MESLKKNKEFILRYINAISGVDKTNELMEKYISDQKLIGHIAFFEQAFPKYEILIEEITAESNRVILLATMTGKHEGDLGGLPATHKEITIKFVIGYSIEQGKISDHWLMADQAKLMEQLGVEPQQAVH